jgi:hypothetical protein
MMKATAPRVSIAMAKIAATVGSGIPPLPKRADVLSSPMSHFCKPWWTRASMRKTTLRSVKFQLIHHTVGRTTPEAHAQ